MILRFLDFVDCFAKYFFIEDSLVPGWFVLRDDRNVSCFGPIIFGLPLE